MGHFECHIIKFGGSTLLRPNYMKVITEVLNLTYHIQNIADRGGVFKLVSLESGYVEHRAQQSFRTQLE